MAAVPFTATIILRGQGNGKVVHMPMTVSDVNAAFGAFPDGSSELQLGSDQNWAIVDIIVVVGGTDTTTMDIFKNNLNASIQIVNKANLNTSNNRQFQDNPIGFEAGSTLKFKQNT